MSNVERSAPKETWEDSLQRGMRAMAGLYKAVWDASQFYSHEELLSYVEGTLRDIESDDS